MNRGLFICVFLCIILMPFSLLARETSPQIGVNPGLDFYSRIDDAGDTLADAITDNRIKKKGNYKNLGCGGGSWIENERINRRLLDELTRGSYISLMQLASRKNVSINTDQLSELAGCMVQKYNSLQENALSDQEALETVGNIGLYMDGDTGNSDYDIITDIGRINTVIFKEKYEYKGTKNGTARALSDFLSENSSDGLMLGNLTGSDDIGGGGSNGSGTTISGSGETSTGSVTDAPWKNVCSAGGSTTSATTGIFGEGFLEGINNVIAGNESEIDSGLAYDADGRIGSGESAMSDLETFGLSEKNDFYHQAPCIDQIFCITINAKSGMQNALGGFSNISIETLLEKHTKMMDPISWSDLSVQKMTNNSYQLPFASIKFKDKIAGGRVFMSNSPQPTRNLQKEATQEIKDAQFEADYRCAMNTAGISGDPVQANGFIGAGFIRRQGETTETVDRSMSPLGPKEAEPLAGCYTIRVGQGKDSLYKGLSTDLNEIQAFTVTMMNTILEIIETDRKLDKLPTK